MSFSLISNTKKLFSTSSTPEGMGALNGMRIISIAWVILGHAYAMQLTWTSEFQIHSKVTGAARTEANVTCKGMRE